MKHEPLHPITKALTTVVLGICRHPDDLEVWERDYGKVLEVRFYPHMADIRVLIGKGGRQAKALRAIAEVMGRSSGIDADFSIRESYRGDRDAERQCPADADFTPEALSQTLLPVIDLAFGKDTVPEISIEDGKFCVVLDVAESSLATMVALEDIFYPYGKNKGRVIRFRGKSFRRQEQHV